MYLSSNGTLTALYSLPVSSKVRFGVSGEIIGFVERGRKGWLPALWCMSDRARYYQLASSVHFRNSSPLLTRMFITVITGTGYWCVVLSAVKPVHIHVHFSFNVCCTPIFAAWPLSLVFMKKTFMHFASLSCMLHISPLNFSLVWSPY